MQLRPGERHVPCLPQVRKEPLGVVALISPWNYPLLLACVSGRCLQPAACKPASHMLLLCASATLLCPTALHAQWKVAPALAAGNACVLKPSEHASLTCLELGPMAAEAGVPPGVVRVVAGRQGAKAKQRAVSITPLRSTACTVQLNIITGTGSEAGAALWCVGRLGCTRAHACTPSDPRTPSCTMLPLTPHSRHPAVSKISFTGSTEGGRSVAAAAAANLRPTTLELGGKVCLHCLAGLAQCATPVSCQRRALSSCLRMRM